MADAQVEIYTQWGCPYCTRAKALLDGKGVAYVEHDVTMGRAALLARLPDARTVPQIFIAGVPVGGCDDLHDLESDGRLDSLLGR